MVFDIFLLNFSYFFVASRHVSHSFIKSWKKKKNIGNSRNGDSNIDGVSRYRQKAIIFDFLWFLFCFVLFVDIKSIAVSMYSHSLFTIQPKAIEHRLINAMQNDGCGGFSLNEIRIIWFIISFDCFSTSWMLFTFWLCGQFSVFDWCVYVCGGNGNTLQHLC